MPCNCFYMGSTVYITVSDFSKSAVTFVLLMIKKLDICRIKSQCSQYVNFAYSVWTRTKIEPKHIHTSHSNSQVWNERVRWQANNSRADYALGSGPPVSLLFLFLYLSSFILTTAVSASLIIQVLKSPRELRLLHVQNQPEQINCFKGRKRANLSLNKD